MHGRIKANFRLPRNRHLAIFQFLRARFCNIGSSSSVSLRNLFLQNCTEYTKGKIHSDTTEPRPNLLPPAIKTRAIT